MRSPQARDCRVIIDKEFIESSSNNLRNGDGSSEGDSVRTVLVRDFAPGDCISTSIVPAPCPCGGNIYSELGNDAARDICFGGNLTAEERPRLLAMERE